MRGDDDVSKGTTLSKMSSKRLMMKTVMILITSMIMKRMKRMRGG